MKNFIEILKNPKKRAVMQLMWYLIFFIIVFALIGKSNNDVSDFKPGNETIDEKPVNEETKDEFLNIKNDYYEYYYIIDGMEISGTFVSDQYIYRKNNIVYYNHDKKTFLYNTMEEIEYFDIEKYSYDTIIKIIENNEFIEKTTYKDGKEKYTYHLNNLDYCDDCFATIESNNNEYKVKIGENIELNYTLKAD